MPLSPGQEAVRRPVVRDPRHQRVGRSLVVAAPGHGRSPLTGGTAVAHRNAHRGSDGASSPSPPPPSPSRPPGRLARRVAVGVVVAALVAFAGLGVASLVGP
ncbi:hypothetical protein GHK86_01320, partial [Acidimicrobiaceae bacterium USS-CC1]|nr:hypothetical protein [Acidiferrimicrobium australe]